MPSGANVHKIIKEIMVAAARRGGYERQPRLRTAVLHRSQSGKTCPETILTCGPIKKGTGELEGVNYEEITYEGYGRAV